MEKDDSNSNVDTPTSRHPEGIKVAKKKKGKEKATSSSNVVVSLRERLQLFSKARRLMSICNERD